MGEKFLTLNNLSYFKTKQDAFNDSKFATKTELAAAKTELEEAIAEVAGGEVGSVITYKGVKDTVAALPQEGNEVGDSYYVTEDNSMHVWNGTSWDSVGEIVVPSIDWADITGKPASFTPAEHTHDFDDVTGLQAALDAKAGKDVATTAADGLMSSEDKTKLDGLANIETIENTEIDALFA